MPVKTCNHTPHVSRITFDVGNGQVVIYELCKDCQELDVFSENILDREEIVPSQVKWGIVDRCPTTTH